MDVDVHVLVEFLIETQVEGSGAEVAQARVGRFLHHVPHLTCKRQLALALHHAYLYREDIPSDVGNRQGRRHADLVLLLGLAVMEPGDPEVLGHIL